MMFGLYIHWPFCLSKCPYCDFNSHVAATIDHEAWRRAYEAELTTVAQMIPDHIVSSIYFGGGTPSLMPPQTVDHVLQTVRRLWRFSNDIEITLEANPTSVEQNHFQELAAIGINRVSLGMQALNAEDLKFLGRQHSVTDAKKALEIAQSTFQHVSFDLIYARPHQTLSSWEQELREALTLAQAGHLSLYQLTIEPGTAFETMYKRKEFILPSDDLGAQLYEMTDEITRDYGLENYEISNYARPGEESRHNLTYWRYQDYAGIGPGAHGRLTLNGNKVATRTRRAPQIWLDQIKTHGHGFHPHTPLTPQDRGLECLLMGLRTKEGIPIERIEQESGMKWENILSKKKLKTLAEGGFIHHTPTHLAATRAGRQRLDYLLSEILI